MTNKQLSYLICPYCNSQFHVNKSFIKKQNNIIFGTVYCNCDEFPVVDGILYLHKSRIKAIVDSLNKHKFHRAVAIALGLSRKKTFIFDLFTQYNKIFNRLPNNFINRVLISFLFNIPPNQFKYYFSRHQEIESLLFFLPLTFKTVTDDSLWLDVGSGITNYYHHLYRLYPKLNIISLENIFNNMYLSHLFFPQKNVTYICSDFSLGLHLYPKTLDIITFIDSFPFIEKQKSSLNLAVSLLKKNGLFFISSMVEHIYLNDFANIFPLSLRLISDYLPSPCQIFDEVKLCQKLFQKQPLQQSLINSSFAPKFRYSLVWPTQILSDKIFMPPSLVGNKYTQWINPSICWKNRVY